MRERRGSKMGKEERGLRRRGKRRREGERERKRKKKSVIKKYQVTQF